MEVILIQTTTHIRRKRKGQSGTKSHGLPLSCSIPAQLEGLTPKVKFLHQCVLVRDRKHHRKGRVIVISGKQLSPGRNKDWGGGTEDKEEGYKQDSLKKTGGGKRKRSHRLSPAVSSWKLKAPLYIQKHAPSP